MDEAKVIARLLSASGSVFGPDGVHMLREKENELIEDLWDTSKVISEMSIGNSVRTNAPAAYAFLSTEDSDQRLIFSVGTDNTLKVFEYVEEEEEWAEQSMDSSEVSKLSLHPLSALAVYNEPDGGPVTVFVVNASGKLQVLRKQSLDGWQIGPELAAAHPKPGTPLSVVTMDDAVLVFYMGLDHTMHYHEQKFGSDTWQGE